MGLFDRSNSRSCHRAPIDLEEAPVVPDGQPSFTTMQKLQRQQRYDPWKHYASSNASPAMERDDPFVNTPTLKKSPSMRCPRSVTRSSIDKMRTSRIPRPSVDVVRPTVEEIPQIRRAKDESPTLKRKISSSFLSIFPRPTPLPCLPEPEQPEGRFSIDQAGRAFSARAGQEKEKLTRHLRESGNRLKHSASKLSLVSSFSNMNEIEDASKSRPFLRSPCRIHGHHSCACTRAIACSITQPVEFQHVTHAVPQQFKNLKSRSRNDLVTDYSVMRAAHKPSQDLSGIRAEEIPASTRCSLDASSALQLTPTPRSGLESTLPSPVPSLTSTSSVDSLTSSPAASSRASQEILTTPTKTAYSFSRPFLDGRPPRLSPSCDSLTAAPTSHHDRFTRSNLKRQPSLNIYHSSRQSDADSTFTTSEPSTPNEDVLTLSPFDNISWQFMQTFESGLPSVVEDDVSGTTTPPPFLEAYRTKRLPAVPPRISSQKFQQAKPMKISRVPVTPPRQLRRTGALSAKPSLHLLKEEESLVC